jgi:hypothetical protein
MKNSMTAAEARAHFAKEKKPLKAAPQKKQPGSTLDISVTELGHLIDQTLIKVPKYIEYWPEKIHCLVNGMEVEITFKVKKK